MSREAIARAPPAPPDEGGVEALNLRRLAADLGVSTMTLYRYVSGRDDIVADVVGLLLAEVDTSERPGEPWDETIRRVTHSLREAALRHPAAFQLMVTAPEEMEALGDHVDALRSLHTAQGMPEAVFERVSFVVGAFVTGSVLLEMRTMATQRMLASRGASLEHGRGFPTTSEALRELMASVFDDGLETVIGGCQVFVGEAERGGEAPVAGGGALPT